MQFDSGEKVPSKGDVSASLDANFFKQQLKRLHAPCQSTIEKLESCLKAYAKKLEQAEVKPEKKPKKKRAKKQKKVESDDEDFMLDQIIAENKKLTAEKLAEDKRLAAEKKAEDERIFAE